MTGGASIAGRWRLIERVDAVGAVTRWLAVEADGGASTWEALLLAPDAGRVERLHFERVHRALEGAPDGAVPTAWVGEHEGAWVAVRPVERSPSPPSPGAASAALPTLDAAVAALGPALGGAVAPRDLRWTAEGALLAPWGAVVPEDAPLTAPEVRAGGAADAQAARFGLGAALYTALTSKLPIPAGLPAGAGTPVRASAWRADLPPALVEALARLLDPSPARRAEAVAVLDAGVVPRATLVPGTLKLTTASGGAAIASREPGPAVGRRDTPPPRAFVAVSGTELRRLEPRARSVIAGLAERPDAAVRDAAAAGLPVVLDAHPDARAARRRAREIIERTGLPARVVAPPGWWPPLALASLAAMSAVSLAVGALLWAWAALAAAAPLALGLLLSVWWLRALGRVREVRAAHSAAPLARASAPVARAWRRAAALRRHLHALDLPLAADADVRDAIRGIEAHLAEVSRVDAAIAEALGAADPGALRTRLAVASRRAADEPAAADERDALARALADLEAIEARKQAVAQDAQEAIDALAELEAALPRGVGAQPTLEAVERATRRAREQLAERSP